MSRKEKSWMEQRIANRKWSEEQKEAKRIEMEGNLYGTTHGGRSWLRTGVMPPGNEEIEEFLVNLRDQFVSDLGGESNVMAGQGVILDLIISQMGYCLLIDKWTMKNGPILPVKQGDKTVDIRMAGPLNSFYLSAQNSIKRNIEILGLHKGRIPQDISEFEKYVQSQGKENETED